MVERMGEIRGARALGYGVLAAGLFWLCGVCVSDEPARVYPGLEPGMSPPAQHP